MNISVCLTRPWPGVGARVIVFVFVITARWYPATSSRSGSAPASAAG
jgi:hypothetical protein